MESLAKAEPGRVAAGRWRAVPVAAGALLVHLLPAGPVDGRLRAVAVALTVAAGIAAWRLRPARPESLALAGSFLLFDLLIALAPDAGVRAPAAGGIAFGLLIGLLGASSARDGLVLWAAVEGTMALALLFVGQGALRSGTLERAGGLFGHPTALYPVLTLGFAAASSIGIGAPALSGLVATFYRGGLLGASVAQIVRSRRPESVALALALGVGGFVVRGWGSSNARSAGVSAFSRWEGWIGSLRLLAQHPLLGVGIGRNAIPVLRSSPNHPGLMVQEGTADARMVLLQWVAELGLVGSGLFGLLLWGIFGTVRRRPDLASAWAAFLVISLFDVPFGADGRVGGGVAVGLLIATSLEKL